MKLARFPVAALLALAISPAFGAAKIPLVFYSPVVAQLKAGDWLQLYAGTTGAPSLNIPCSAGVAPASPNDGDEWCTSAGRFYRLGSTTIGPLTGGGSGTVTSVAMTGDGTIFASSVTGSPITTSGTLAESLLTHAANTFLAGPASGSAAAPTFRAIVSADLPLGTNSAPGALQCDGATTTCSGGIVSSTGGTSGANPTATAGPSAVNGSATTFMRSDAAPAVQKASASQFGIAEVDGTSITASSGVISASGSLGGTAVPWWNATFPNQTPFTHSFAASANYFTPASNITISAASVLLTTVNSGVYNIGIAPFNGTTNQITGAPTYVGAVTVGSSAGAANSWISGKFSPGFACTAGTTYIIFIVRTDSTTTVSTTLNTSNNMSGLPPAPALGLMATGLHSATVGSAHIASIGPLTSDTWTQEGGFYVIDFSYYFT
jgi:hypothetical protein